MFKSDQNLLIADESNLIQARCVLKENLCGEGYFLGPTSRCAMCDEACELCHGAGQRLYLFGIAICWINVFEKEMLFLNVR